MTLMHIGALKLHTHLPRSNPAEDHAMDRTMTSYGMLSPLELRRLVAGMID